VLFVTLPVYFVTASIESFLYQVPDGLAAILGTTAIVYLTATTIATRELIRSAQLVISSVSKGDMEAAQRDVSMIVGRDTRELPEEGVLKATIETLAENLSDGIVAPLFYLAVGGLPLAMTYKAINTLDSMVGYKNEKYRYLGWAAARLDDCANYLPARITGLMIVLSSFLVSLVKPGLRSLSLARQSFIIMQRDGRKHPSPNSGIPEAAMAGALRIRLGGPSTYAGVLSNKPFIGDEERSDYLAASHDAIRIVLLASAFAALLTIVISALRMQ
jgi:adenosylcobinamide-phosphate synthase